MEDGMEQVTIPKTIHRVLANLTGENRADVALELATKDLLRLKLKEVEGQIKEFETRHQMRFDEFKQAWNSDQVADKHSYAVEKDYWEWEAATGDEKKYREMLDELL
jgi:hypothetical protein